MRGEAMFNLRLLSSREVEAPGTGLLLSIEEVYTVGGTRYRLVTPGFVPSFLGDEFRRTQLCELDDRALMSSIGLMSFCDREAALRWLRAG